MKFQRNMFGKVLLSAVLIGANIILFYVSYLLMTTVALISVFFMLIIWGANYRIANGKLSRHFLFIKSYEVDISEIKEIEFYSERKSGYISINIGSPDEDEYKLLLTNGDVLKIPSYYMNNKQSVGRYLCYTYKIKKKDTNKLLYIYGN